MQFSIFLTNEKIFSTHFVRRKIFPFYKKAGKTTFFSQKYILACCDNFLKINVYILVKIKLRQKIKCAHILVLYSSKKK